MTILTPEEEQKKRDIFEAMSPKRQQRILNKGYENWDPFQKPKEPFEKMQSMEGGRTQSLHIAGQFFAEKNLINPNNDYAQGVIEICRGLIQKDERYRGMFEFCLWYKEGKREEKT